MAGLIDTTGLSFGVGLQWGTPIGGDGLIIVTNNAPATVMITETSDPMITETGDFMVTE